MKSANPLLASLLSDFFKKACEIETIALVSRSLLRPMERPPDGISDRPPSVLFFPSPLSLLSFLPWMMRSRGGQRGPSTARTDLRWPPMASLPPQPVFLSSLFSSLFIFFSLFLLSGSSLYRFALAQFDMGSYQIVLLVDRSSVLCRF